MSAAAGAYASAAGAPYRTLLVDDVESLRMLYRTILEASGRFEVVGEAADGVGAVQQASRLQPDLILLDVSMPDRDGIEALPDVLAASPVSQVVMLSGFEAHRLAPLAVSRGASGYLEKGITPDRLVVELLDILGDGAAADPPSAPAHAAAPVVVDTSSAPAGPAPSSLEDIGAHELLSVAAHELRNPLSVIAGFADMLIEDDLDREETIAVGERIARNARYLDGVVRGLLQMRMLAGEDTAAEMRAVEAAALIEDITETLSGEHPAAALVSEVEADLPAVVADPERLRQVLANVVGNAARYAPDGTPVRLRASRHDHDLLIEVHDDGPGIPAEERERVFGKFVRTEARTGGLGVGLYISRALVTAMGGRIWIADAPTGTTVCILLPAAPLPKT